MADKAHELQHHLDVLYRAAAEARQGNVAPERRDLPDDEQRLQRMFDERIADGGVPALAQAAEWSDALRRLRAQRGEV